MFLLLLFLKVSVGRAQCLSSNKNCEIVNTVAIKNDLLQINDIPLTTWMLKKSVVLEFSGVTKHIFKQDEPSKEATIFETPVTDGESYWEGILGDTIIRICDDQHACRMIHYEPGKRIVDVESAEFDDFPEWESGKVVDRSGIESAAEQFIDEVSFYDETDPEAEEGIGVTVELDRGFEIRDFNVVWVPSASLVEGEMEALMRNVVRRMNSLFEFHRIPLRLSAGILYERPIEDEHWSPTHELDLLPKCRQWANQFGRTPKFVPYEWSGAMWHCQFPSEYFANAETALQGLGTLPDDISIAVAGIHKIRTVMHELGHNLGCENQRFCFSIEPFGMRTLMGGGNSCGYRGPVEITETEEFCDQEKRCIHGFAEAFTDHSMMLTNELGLSARLGSRLWNCAGLIKETMPVPRCPDADPFERGICLIGQDQACRHGTIILDSTPYITDCANALRLNPLICPTGRFSFSFSNSAYGCHCCEGKRYPDRDFDIYQIHVSAEVQKVTCFAAELQGFIGNRKKILTPMCEESVGFLEGQECKVECLFGDGEETWKCERTINGGSTLTRMSEEVYCDKPRERGQSCGLYEQCDKFLTCMEGACWPHCRSNRILNDFSSRDSMEDNGWTFTRILAEQYGSAFKGSSKSPSPGMISARLEGNGTVAITFGNVEEDTEGEVSVLLNGKAVGSISHKREVTTSIHFLDGDVISIEESGEAMIELNSLKFTCDRLPVCKGSWKFCPGGLKIELSPFGGCTYPQCPEPDRSTCIGCVFLGGVWAGHSCKYDCGGESIACYKTVEDCDYYQSQMEEKNVCQQQIGCIQCTSQRHCKYDELEESCTFIGENWWEFTDSITTTDQCPDCLQCVRRGSKFNFDNRCELECKTGTTCYETEDDCKVSSAMQMTSCEVYDSCTSCLNASPFCAFDEKKESCILADFADADSKNEYVDDIGKCDSQTDIITDTDFIAFPGRYDRYITDEEKFLKECSHYTHPHMTCETVMPGLWTQSIIIFFEGSALSMVLGLENIRKYGFNLPSFPDFGKPIENVKASPQALFPHVSNRLTRVPLYTCSKTDSEMFIMLPDTFSRATCATHTLNHPECGKFFIVRSKVIPCGCVKKDMKCKWDGKPLQGEDACDKRHHCNTAMYHISDKPTLLQLQHLSEISQRHWDWLAIASLSGLMIGLLILVFWSNHTKPHDSSPPYVAFETVT